MPGLFAGTSLERPVTCAVCEKTLDACECPRNDDGDVVLPGEQKITVRKENRRKGKVVTHAFGFDSGATDVAALLKALKSSCGAGGSATDDGLEIQGDHREHVAAALRERGYKVRVN